MTDIPTLTRIAAFGRPMIVSTGMATFEEIDRTYAALAERGVSLALMNCVSEYPPRYDDMNIAVICKMIARYDRALIGHSDHAPDNYTSFAAVALGARIIEKHVILDKRQPGPDRSVSIDFRELADLCEGIRKIEAALGEEKRVHGREQQIRTWAFRSIVTTRAVRTGEVVTQEAIWSKRPGSGIPSHLMGEVVGRRVRRNVAANSMLSWEDLEPV
jgi:N-acetylneuraminate synthase